MIDAPRPERWEAIKAAIDPPLRGKSLLDLGCHEGAFVGAALAEGMNACGFDSNRSFIVQANARWPDGLFVYKDFALETTFADVDVMLLLSTWAYIAVEHGALRAEFLLHYILEHTACLFFETQLRADGPGPWFLETDDDVKRMLARYGDPEAIITLPVDGREASRTVWKVQPRSV